MSAADDIKTHERHGTDHYDRRRSDCCDGEQYALLAGFIGLIGSFITGSNMSSNILFTDVQVSAAAGLGTGKPCPAGCPDFRSGGRQYDLAQQDSAGSGSSRAGRQRRRDTQDTAAGSYGG